MSFKQATVEDIANRRITRLHGRVVVVTHYYPRFLKSNMIHEYVKDLAPPRELLTEFNEKKEELGDHNRAFEAIQYEEKFWLSEEGLVELQKLALEAQTGAVYLVCHCKVGLRCHRELLMVMAAEKFKAPIGRLSFDWARFRERVANSN
jgi:uncharacterized protein YeaO (DUF488 family)